MFSSDLSDRELKDRLSHVTIPVLAVFSLSDEFVPSRILIKRHTNVSSQFADVNVPLFADRIQKILPKSEVLRIEGADHSISNHVDYFVSVVMEWILKHINK